MVQPKTLFILAVCLLVASRAAAQAQPPSRQRQDRRTALAATPSGPMPELYLAAGNLTTVVLNGSLDPDSLVVDRTRFKWADAGDRFLVLELASDLPPGERLIINVGFADRALPAQAVFAVLTHPRVMDGTVEVDRRANTPEALMETLSQKEAELERLKARYEGRGPSGVVSSELLGKDTAAIGFICEVDPGDASGLRVKMVRGYKGSSSARVAIRLRNLPGQSTWALGRVHLTSAGGAPGTVISVQMQPPYLAPGEEGEVVLETKTPPWVSGNTFAVELVDANGQRRLSLNLSSL